MNELEIQIQKYRNLVEQALKKVLQEKDLPQQQLLEAMRYSVGAGGKRIRPVLLLAFCEGCGGDVEKAAPFAAAIEMLHSYSLIHDDLPCMDNDDMRRGKPSCHIQFGEALALLAGDGLLNRCFEVMLFSCLTVGQNGIKAAVTLSKAAGVMGMIGGQVLDLEMEEKTVSKEQLLTMYHLKTGCLLSAACRMGCELAGAVPEISQTAEEFGDALGLAFQIVDDLLDLYGDAKILGKPTGSDLENQKTTFATLCSREEAKAYASELTKKAKLLLNKMGLSTGPFLYELTSQLLEREK